MIDERTGLEVLDEAECWKLLGSQAIGRLAVAIGNQADIFPVNFALDGQDIIIHTIPGTKLAATVLNTNVTFEVDDLNREERKGWSVVARGTGEDVDDLEELMRMEELSIHPWTTAKKLRYLRIRVNEIAGRRLP